MAGKSESTHAIDLTEYEEQKIIFQWVKTMTTVDSRYYAIFAIPNAAKRSWKTAQVMKSQGMKSGFPDIACLWPSPPYYGLFVELKKIKGGVVSPEQTWWIELLNSHGYKALVCKGAQEAITVINKYMGQR